MRDDLIKLIFNKAKKNRNIFLLTADLGYSLFDEFAKNLPNQFINVGICEQNMISLSAGLAKERKKVFVYSIGNFSSLRCLEFIRNNICYHNLDVSIISCGSGYEYGQLGFSHHATEVLSVMRSIPNIHIYNPATVKELAILNKEIFYSKPKFILINKKTVNDISSYNTFPSLKKIKGKILICSTGSILDEAMKASNALNVLKMKTEIISIPQVKPFKSIKKFINTLKNFKYIFTLEENNINGGFGELILNIVNKHNLNINLHIIGINDEYMRVVGDKYFLRKRAKIDHLSIKKIIINTIKTNQN